MKSQRLDRVSFGLSSKVHSKPVMVNGARVIEKLNIPSVKLPKRAAIEQWSHLSGIHLPDLDGSEVMLSCWI